MNSFLNWKILDNTVESYLWVIGVIIVVIFLNRFLSRWIAYLSCKYFVKRWEKFDQKKFTDLIVYPLGVFLVITVSIVALYGLNYPAAFNFKIYKYTIEQVLESIAIAALIISFVWVVFRIIDFIAYVLQVRTATSETRNEMQLIVFFRDFIKVLIAIIGIILVLSQAFNYNVTSLLTGLSIVGAAIALALKESLENLIASFVIFFDKPFTTGDFVRVQGVSGTIERIGLRSTRVRTVEKAYVTVPNKKMVDSILENVSMRSQMRGEVNLLISVKNTTIAQVQELLSEVRNYLRSIPEVEVKNLLLNDIRGQDYNLYLEYFTPPIDMARFTEIKESINFFIMQTIERLEIKIAP